MLETRTGIDVVYCDFKKAFDKVPHQQILKKVESYVICGNLLQWIEVFLIGRQ